MEARDGQLRRAIALSAISVIWSGGSGVLAVAIALTTGSLSLLGFGVDAVLDSAASVALIWRFVTERSRPDHGARLERVAQRIVGMVLLAFAVYLATGAARALLAHDEPGRSVPALALLFISLAVLPPLAVAKHRTASRLASGALRADSLLTALAAVLAAIGLVSAVLAATLHAWWADAVGAIVVAVVLLREGWLTLLASRRH